jgi:hypothetical protein
MTAVAPPDFTRFCAAFTAGLLAGETTSEAGALPEQASFAAVMLAVDQTGAALIARPTGGVRVVRADLECLLVRAWLFGIVSEVERRLRQDLTSQAAWQELLSPERIARARTLKAERERRGEHPNTMACLQFGDLGQMGVRAAWWQRWLPLGSNRQAKELAKRLEGLRNDLAHGQDVIERHWDTVIALSANLQALGGR